MSILRSKQSDVEIPASLSCPDFLFENVQEYTNKIAVVSIAYQITYLQKIIDLAQQKSITVVDTDWCYPWLPKKCHPNQVRIDIPSLAVKV